MWTEQALRRQCVIALQQGGCHRPMPTPLYHVSADSSNSDVSMKQLNTILTHTHISNPCMQSVHCIITIVIDRLNTITFITVSLLLQLSLCSSYVCERT